MYWLNFRADGIFVAMRHFSVNIENIQNLMPKYKPVLISHIFDHLYLYINIIKNFLSNQL